MLLTTLLISGFIGVISMLMLSLHQNLSLTYAMLSLMAGSAGVAIADVTMDACVTENSINHPSLAGDMQSLGGLSSSIGALIGFSVSGFLVHIIGSKVLFYTSSLPTTIGCQYLPFALCFQNPDVPMNWIVVVLLSLEQSNSYA